MRKICRLYLAVFARIPSSRPECGRFCLADTVHLLNRRRRLDVCTCLYVLSEGSREPFNTVPGQRCVLNMPL